ncbi:MAG: hypothetical protein V2I33_06150 [Kangiellaceae bacterium]|jgi:hypothetical protein|nr:hypothetical protein [Kangiellaceae bacterium]
MDTLTVLVDTTTSKVEGAKAPCFILLKTSLFFIGSAVNNGYSISLKENANA